MRTQNPGTAVLALALTSLWLIAGPLLVAAWEVRLDRLLRLLDTCNELTPHAQQRMGTRRARYRPWAAINLAIPIVLILTAFFSADHFSGTGSACPRTG